jgi:uncharacterized protein
VTIVSNTSPITNLAAIAHLDFLHRLYGKIVIPQAVYDELTTVGYAVPGAAEVQALDWIEVQQVRNREQVVELCQVLDAGEAEATTMLAQTPA